MANSGDGFLAKFGLGGLSCMAAACVTNPIDVIKIRMQMEGELALEKGVKVEKYYKGTFSGLGRILQEEGIRGVYKGLSPSLLREGSYSTIRMGLYEPFKATLGDEPASQMPLWKKVVAGGAAGATGSAIANPTDLIKVRMQAAGPNAKELSLGGKKFGRYTSVWHGFSTVFKTEGFAGLYRGTVPTTKRAALLTASQLPSYDHVKHMFLSHGIMEEGLSCHMASSMIAGLVAAIVTSPVDVVKTRVMNQNKFGGEQLYSGTIDCFAKILRTEGPRGLYKGFIPNWLRIGPHTIVTFLIFEKLRSLTGIKPI